MHINKPYLLFLGDVPDQLAAKTAIDVAHWRPDDCIGQLRLPACKADLGLPDLGLYEAFDRGAKTLLVGVANSGGLLPEHWIKELLAALDAGFDIASGLHMRLNAISELKEKADALGRHLFDVRHPTETFNTGTGKKRSGKRLLTVGTDCSVGKMYTSLALEQELRRRHVKASFRATGQTGILISGNGVSVDAVVADFISGAVEWLSPANDDKHWDLIEGQGSLFHPAFAGVSLGLLHGAQPDIMVLCHEPTRNHMRGLPHAMLPSLEQCLQANEAAARLTNPDARVIGVSVNTAQLTPHDADALMAEISDQLGLPCVDPVRTGVVALADVMPL